MQYCVMEADLDPLTKQVIYPGRVIADNMTITQADDMVYDMIDSHPNDVLKHWWLQVQQIQTSTCFLCNGSKVLGSGDLFGLQGGRHPQD